MTLLYERKETAYKRLKNNPVYLEVYERQQKTGEDVEKLYHERFTKDERITVRRHYEGETEKNCLEEDEVYFQGMRDCFQFILHLGILAD